MFPRLLICEGAEDHWFLHKLIETWKIQRFHIQPAGGNTKFANAISQFELEKTTAFNGLADVVVVADNNDAPGARFDNACAEIRKAFGASAVPSGPQVASKSKPRCSVLMVPWTGVEGTLEGLCVDAAKDADKTTGAHVDAFLATLKAETWQSNSRFGKAWLRSNLAARCAVDPFVPLGKAFNDKKHAGLIPIKHKSFKQIADFLAKVGKT
jgi:hypothetical protein